MCSGTPSRTQSLMARCVNPVCSAVFCRSCCRDWHDGVRCEDAKSHDERLAAALARRQSGGKQCPRCQQPLIHFESHHCHHVTCMSCGLGPLCFVCLKLLHDPAHVAAGCQLWCDGRCGCLPCDVCRPRRPCSLCNGSCKVCQGLIPAPSYERASVAPTTK
eukprot:m51a1_g13221 hypothetical protein (161) ;mRNA; r:1930-2412